MLCFNCELPIAKVLLIMFNSFLSLDSELNYENYLYYITHTIDEPKIFSVETLTCFKDKWLITILTSRSTCIWGSEKPQIRQFLCPADACTLFQLSHGRHHTLQKKSLKAIRRNYSNTFFVLWHLNKNILALFSYISLDHFIICQVWFEPLWLRIHSSSLTGLAQ